MAVGIVYRHGRLGTGDCSDLRERRDRSFKIDQLESQPEATGRPTAVWVELEDSVSEPSGVVLRTGAVLLEYQSQPQGFVKPPRALQVGAAKNHERQPRGVHRGVSY